MGYNENCYNHLRESRKQARKYGGCTEQDIWRTTSVYVDRNTGEIIEQRRLENGEYIKLKKTINYGTNGRYKSKTITTECEENQRRIFE
jgi:hypothetical protein